jgi:hypothetical protein
MNENENEKYEDRGEEGNRDGQDEGEREREDPFDTYGRAYYAPGARAALGFGDAYDLFDSQILTRTVATEAPREPCSLRVPAWLPLST